MSIKMGLDLTQGKIYVLDAAFRNSGLVEVVGSGNIMCSVRDVSGGKSWDVMKNRITEVTEKDLMKDFIDTLELDLLDVREVITKEMRAYVEMLAIFAMGRAGIRKVKAVFDSELVRDSEQEPGLDELYVGANIEWCDLRSIVRNCFEQYTTSMPNAVLGTTRVMDVSTLHISQDDLAAIYDDDDSRDSRSIQMENVEFTVRQITGGLEILVHTLGTEIVTSDCYSSLVKASNALGMSDALAQIIVLAHFKGCTNIIIDQDGTVWVALKTYNW